MTGLRWSFATLAFTLRLAIGFASGWSPAAPVRSDDTSSGACGTPVAMYGRSPAAGAEALHDLAASRVRERGERIVSHFANYIVRI